MSESFKKIYGTYVLTLASEIFILNCEEKNWKEREKEVYAWQKRDNETSKFQH